MDLYFDSMLISQLRNGIKHDDIRQLLINNSENHTFFYSKAHILDLKNDKTDEKLLELDYINKFIGNNYLCRYFNQPIKIYSLSAIEAFEEEIQSEKDTISSVNDIFINPLIKSIEEHLMFPINIPEIVEFNSFSLPDEYKTYLENIYTNNFSIKNLYENQMAFQTQLENNQKIYRYLRGIIKENVNLFIKENYNKDILLKEKIFIKNKHEMTFNEYIDSNIIIHSTNSDEIFYNKFLLGYNILNLLGLDNEKNRNAKFKNTFNDGLHSYYASYCDILITDDLKMKDKATIMYELFDIKTKIINSENLLDNISKIS
jgi:hypothetical protein